MSLLRASSILAIAAAAALAQRTSNYPAIGQIVRSDPAFTRLVPEGARIEVLATGFAWAEGPVWVKNGGFLLFSDIPRNSVMKWTLQDGATVFLKPSGFTGIVDYGHEPGSNGLTIDAQGRLISCEHGDRRVSRLEIDGGKRTLADNYQGKRLNSPNDVIVKSDGSIWFTDPSFGIDSFYEGEKQEPELPQNVYRVDGQTGDVTMVCDEVIGPNGLAFSPDESVLYIVESRSKPRTIRAFDVAGDGRSLTNNRVLIDAQQGTPDGFRVDTHGNLWCGWGMGTDELDGVRVFSPQGEALGHIALPERCANVCFGGRHRNRLFMAASHGLYSLYVNTQGVRGG